MASKIQVRRDTAANWTSQNPVPDTGEISFVTDTGKMKIGDGTSGWGSLGYYGADIGGGAFVSGANDNITPTIANDNSISGNVWHGSILGGHCNTMFAPNVNNSSSILGGHCNAMNENGSNNTISGGSNNIMGAVGYSAIIGGNTNKMYCGINSIISGGSENLIQGYNTLDSSILGGRKNRLKGPRDSTIVGGYYNYLNWQSQQTSLIGGRSNCTGIYTYRSSIVGGCSNILCWSDDATILGGKSHYLCESDHSAIIGGNAITMENVDCTVGMPKVRMGLGTGGALPTTGETHMLGINSATGEVIQAILPVGGGSGTSGDAGYGAFTSDAYYNILPLVANSNYINSSALHHSNTIGGGQNNTMCDNSHSSISGGSSNYIGYKSNCSHITGGCNHVICDYSDYSAVIGGNDNTVQYYSDNSGVFEGQNNTVYCSNCSVIIGGQDNNICYSESSTLLSGQNNAIEYSINSISVGGYYNKLLGSHYAIIGGGQYNCVDNSTYGISIGGYNNYLVNSHYSAIIGGNNNTICAGSNTSVIAGGYKNSINTSSCYSGIFAGYNNSITTSSCYSAIIGGYSITVTDNNTVAMPKLRIGLGEYGALPTTGETHMLGINSATGEVIQAALPVGGTNGNSTNEFQTIPSSNDIELNATAGKNAEVTLTQHSTISITNMSNGDEGTLIITQDSTGGWQASFTNVVIFGNAGAANSADDIDSAADSISMVKWIYKDGSDVYITYYTVTSLPPV